MKRFGGNRDAVTASCGNFWRLQFPPHLDCHWIVSVAAMDHAARHLRWPSRHRAAQQCRHQHQHGCREVLSHSSSPKCREGSSRPASNWNQPTAATAFSCWLPRGRHRAMHQPGGKDNLLATTPALKCFVQSSMLEPAMSKHMCHRMPFKQPDPTPLQRAK